MQMTGEMLARQKKKDSSQMEDIIAEYGNDVFRLCLLYLGNRSLAEEAYQETMIKIWYHLSSFRGESEIKTWINRVAVNTCQDIRKSSWFQMWSRSEPEEKLYRISQQETEDHGEVRSAIGKLRRKYREVIVLYYYEGMKTKEIAAVLNIPVNTVSTRLKRGKELLKKYLREEYEWK